MTEPTFEQPREKLLRVELKSDKRSETEDASFINMETGVLVAADGVTRGPFDEGEDYPSPSPARLAAEAATQAIGGFLVSLDSIEPSSMMAAIREGNTAVLAINKQLKLWGDTDYLQNDLAGTVISAIVPSGDKVVYGYIGDCRVVKLNSSYV